MIKVRDSIPSSILASLVSLNNNMTLSVIRVVNTPLFSWLSTHGGFQFQKRKFYGII